MRVLALSSRPPWPPTMADAMTVDRLVRFLVDRGHEVDLACFVEDDDAERSLREGLGDVCSRIEAVRLPKLASYARTREDPHTTLDLAARIHAWTQEMIDGSDNRS